jgi:glc operon protein GlcG
MKYPPNAAQRSYQQSTKKEGMAVSLTLEEADAIIRGAMARAEKIGISVSVAVCDSGGRLKAFSRMDGATWASTLGSQGKAIAAAGFGRPSGELADRADSPVIRGILRAEGDHMIPSQGAVPIIRDGVIEGACGVGGGTSEQDEECARAAAVETLPA